MAPARPPKIMEAKELAAKAKLQIVKFRFLSFLRSPFLAAPTEVGQKVQRNLRNV